MGKQKTPAGDFIIGDTDFGIDPGQSRWDWKSSPDGRRLLTVEIHGSQEAYDRVKAAEEAAWAWTLYPPHFYLRNYPVPAPVKGKAVTVQPTPEDVAGYDVALYLMEHHDVDAVTIRMTGNRLEVSGRVDLMGEERDFRIRWAKS
jgi:hypothetical protein